MLLFAMKPCTPFLRAALLLPGLFFSAGAAGSADSSSNGPSLLLENTEIGQAVAAESPKAYLEAFKKLQENSDEIARNFTAKTSQGESLFHLLAGAQSHQEFFAGEIFYIGAFLSNSSEPDHGRLYYRMIQNENREGKIPAEIASEAGNVFALRILTELEIMIKKEEREKAALIWNPGSKIFEIEDFEKIKNYGRDYYISSGMLTFMGLFMLHKGLFTPIPDSILTAVLGAMSLSTGLVGAWRACREGFREKRNKK